LPLQTPALKNSPCTDQDAQTGYECNRSGCFPPQGSTLTYSQDCQAGYYLCPSSVGYGCCQSGMGCGLAVCFSTGPSTYVYTQTSTITLDGSAITSTATITTTSTPSTPTESVFPVTGVAKIYTNVIAKTEPTEAPSSSSGGGLTTPQIIGIVVGLVGLLIIVLVLSFIIVRRLNKTKQAVDQSQKDTSSGEKQSRQSGVTRFKPTSSQVDQMEYDDLMQSTPGETPLHGRDRSGSEFSSANQSPFPSSTTDARHVSMDSSGYFDVPTRVQNRPGRHSISTDARTSMDSHVPAWQQFQQRPRAASELSSGNVSAAPGPSYVLSAATAAELSAHGPLPELQGSQLPGSPTVPVPAAAAVSISHPPQVHQRRRSEGNVHSRERSASSTATPQLGVVGESFEQSSMHGYYGPQNHAVGQTRAGADVLHDMTSPVAPGFGAQQFPPQ